MKIPIALWKLLDWQGPLTGVRFRITADDSFLARDDDDSGVEVDASPKVFREVDCVVATEVIEGLSIKTITIPALWLFSTTDAIHNRTARYSAKFVTSKGGDIKPLELLQSFQVPAAIIQIFNPVPWAEIIRFNFAAAPVPIDRTVFSSEQIMELIGQGAINGGPNVANGRVAIWSGPITIDAAVGFNWQNIDNAVAALNLNTPSALFNTFRIAEGAGNANVKVGGSPSLFSTHVTDQTGIWHHAFANDAATRRWAQFVRDGALGLQFSAYDNSNVLQSNTIFDPSGGVGFSDGTNPDFGYLFKNTSAYHLGINAAGAGSGSATKEITFTTSGVGINKPTSIGSQLHVVSGAAGRVGFIVDSASSPSQPLMLLRNNTSQRFLFDHDGRAEFGLASNFTGRLTLAVSGSANKTSLEAALVPASSVVYRLPAVDPAGGQLLRTGTFSGGIATLEWVNPTAGGDVSSSIGSTVDNRLTRFDGTTGKLIQDSAVVVADTTGSFTVPNGWTVANAGGSSLALNQFGSVFTAPSGSQVSFNLFEFIGGTQSQSSTDIHNHIIRTTYNQTATAGSDELFLIRTETALGSGLHSFIRGWGGAAGTTLRFRIDNLGNYYFGSLTGNFIGDSAGNEVLKIEGVGSAVSEFRMTNAASGAGNRPSLVITSGDADVGMQVNAKGTGEVVFGSNIQILKSTPVVKWVHSGLNKTWIQTINGSGQFVIGEDGISNAITIDDVTGEVFFEEIPQGPNATPTTDNQLGRKKYIDDKAVFFTLSYKVDDPSTFSVGTRAVLPITRVPNIASGFMTKCHVIYSSGSHTSGGVLEFAVEVGFSEVGTVQLNNTNSASGTFYTSDFADSAITDGSALSAYLKTRTGTITERDVTLIFEGYQKVKSL